MHVARGLRLLGRMRGLLGAVVVMTAACHGLVSGGGDDSTSGSTTPEEKIAEEKWIDEAMPAFTTSSCTSCHEGQPMGDGNNFLQADNDADRREVLLQYQPQLVNLDDESGSVVLNEGVHTGPALPAPASAAILDWIEAEKAAQAAANPVPVIQTAPFTVMLCTLTEGQTVADCPVNQVDLDSLQVPGAQVRFIAQVVGTDIYVTDLVAVAGSQGLFLQHPLFTTYPPDADPLPDLFDRFSSVKLDLMPTTVAVACPPEGPSCALIGAGDATFHEFDPVNPITITFEVLGVYQDNSAPPPPPSGCGSASLAAFVQDVVPLMTTAAPQNCNQCHSMAGSTAQENMSLENIASTTDNTACLSVLSNVTLTDIPQSGLFLAPTAGVDPTHPYKLTTTTNPTFDAFQTGVNAWLAVEQMN
jgi:hypothetical protein